MEFRGVSAKMSKDRTTLCNPPLYPVSVHHQTLSFPFIQCKIIFGNGILYHEKLYSFRHPQLPKQLSSGFIASTALITLKTTLSSSTVSQVDWSYR
jgi:hypothetical protein